MAGQLCGDPRVAEAANCKVVVYAPGGLMKPSAALRGPGLVLSGAGFLGMPYDEVLAWLARRMPRSTKRTTGNLLVLQASGEDDYTDVFYRASRLASVREILVPPCAPRSAVDAVAPYVNAADAVLFAGGDQSNYVAWKTSALMAAVRRVYARGGVVGGGSAGLAIQGAIVYDAVGADRVLPDDADLGSRLAARNPYGPAVTLTTGLFAWPPLADTITDTHFARRDRFGRLAAFMARAYHGGLVRGPRIYGLGVDEGSTLVVDSSGIATLLERSGVPYRTRGAYVLSGGAPRRIGPREPLLYTVDVTHLTVVGSGYDLVHHRGAGARYSVTVDGTRSRLYDRDPY
jgi:cyanophycinase-like exopeptidase